MTASLDDLISPETPDETLSYFLTELAAVGFPTTAWQTGSVIYTLLRIEALSISDKVKLVAAIARGVLLDLSSGAWLTLLARSHYGLDRYPAAFAVGRVRLSIAAGSPAQTINPGQIWIKTAAGYRYNAVNAAPVAIASGGAAVLDFRAESPGVRYNVPLGTGLTLTTPLPGLVAAFENAGAGTWLTTQGQDEESDAALKVRCRTRWATIGIQKVHDAYVHLATNTPALTTQPNRVLVDDANPRGPGTLDVWLAGPSGPLSAADETAVRAYVVARASPCADVQVQNAATRTVSVAATVFYEGGYANAIAQATDNLLALINGLAIGATLHLAEVIEAIMAPDGVRDAVVPSVTINGANADLALAVNEVAVAATINLTGILV